MLCGQNQNQFMMPGMQPNLQTGEKLWSTDWVNTLTEEDWRSYLFNLAITRFEWLNMPDEVDSRFVELVLLTYGWGAFFEPTPGYLAFAPASQTNNLDMYWNPRKVTLIPANGTGFAGSSSWSRYCRREIDVDNDGNLTVHEQDAVECFDNMAREPYVYKLELAAKRLARIDRAIDVNVNAQLTPWIGVAKEEAKLDLERYMNQVLGFESVVLEDEGFTNNVTASVLPTTAPFVADSLMSIQDRRINRIMTQLGIDNAFSQKKEREIAGEMDANNEQICIARETGLRTRQKAAQKCNELFGTSIEVRIASHTTGVDGVSFSDEVV